MPKTETKAHRTVDALEILDRMIDAVNRNPQAVIRESADVVELLDPLGDTDQCADGDGDRSRGRHRHDHRARSARTRRRSAAHVERGGVRRSTGDVVNHL